MNKIYLVDFENVGSNGLKGIENLTENDTVIIFYSFRCNKISFQMHQLILNCKTNIVYKEVQNGHKNALDFQLSSYLGYLLSSKPTDSTQFTIISNDNDYDDVISFWNSELSLNIYRVADLTFKLENIKSNFELVSKLIKEESALNNHHNELKELINNGNKDKLHTFLQEKLGFKKANILYGRIKKTIW